jgi:hypothetical protein
LLLARQEYAIGLYDDAMKKYITKLLSYSGLKQQFNLIANNFVQPIGNSFVILTLDHDLQNAVTVGINEGGSVNNFVLLT